MAGAAKHGNRRAGAWRSVLPRVIQRVYMALALTASMPLLAGDVAAPDKVRVDNVFAVVGAEPIGWDRFDAMSRALARQRFFHGGVPPEEVEAFNREVERTLVDRTLLLQEARRRGHAPRREEIDRRIAAVDARNGQSPGWRAHRDSLLQQLRSELEENDLLEQLETEVKDIPLPQDADIRRYYDAHQDRFVTPSRARVSLILLRVEPWASGEQWRRQTALAQQLVARLRDGADFGALAREYSGHESAASGGDLGMIHQGMLAADAQQVLDRMTPGGISEPVRLLQGIAILRLDEVVPPALNAYAEARHRAAELLRREQQESAWNAFIEGLRDNTSIVVYRRSEPSRHEQPESRR